MVSSLISLIRRVVILEVVDTHANEAFVLVPARELISLILYIIFINKLGNLVYYNNTFSYQCFQLFLLYVLVIPYSVRAADVCQILYDDKLVEH
jgi:hypothetical protein